MNERLGPDPKSTGEIKTHALLTITFEVHRRRLSLDPNQKIGQEPSAEAPPLVLGIHAQHREIPVGLERAVTRQLAADPAPSIHGPRALMVKTPNLAP